GFYATWTFPQINTRHGGRSDTAAGHAGLMPGNFIAPLWYDAFYGDSARRCGRILYGNGGDTCQFIVEWDSVGVFPIFQFGCDQTVFRAVLNRCDGTIEYQWDDVGTLAEDSFAIVGLQADSTALTVEDPTLNQQEAYVMINNNAYPS